MQRREFLQTALAMATVLSSGFAAAADGDRYAGLDSDRYFGPVEIAAKVEDRKVFTEGPTVARDGTVYFVNAVASKILRWDPRAKALSVFREYTNETNGMHFDDDGRLLCCEGAAGRVTRIDLKTGELTVIADKFRGRAFAAPNDICTDHAGRIYFTSRPGPTDPEKGNVNSVYRVDPDGHVEQILKWPEVHMPNGIDISPDGKTLYVVEAHPDADHHRDIRAYDLLPDGKVANGRVVINFYPGRSGDGMAVDSAGNLVIAAGLHKTRKTSETLDTRPGIHLVTPEGKLLAFRETPEDTLTNCEFGGDDRRTLYATCGPYLLTIRTTIPGKPLKSK